MTAPNEVIVLTFFQSDDGELRCRMRDADSRDYWVVRDPYALLELLRREQAQSAAVLRAASSTARSTSSASANEAAAPCASTRSRR